jgi:hypothetical protein
MSVHSSARLAQVEQLMARSIEGLPFCQRWWLRAHLIDPRPIMLRIDPATISYLPSWLVTDHIGLDDAPFRVVCDGSSFGLELALDDGDSYAARLSLTLEEAVSSL